jgi:uncharacterized membrane protein
MSSSTRSPDAGAADARFEAGAAPRAAFALRCAGAIAYPLLAHAAALSGDGRVAAFAALDLVLIVLVVPLLRLRPLAWAAFATAAFAAAWLARGPHALLPLLLAPPAFVAVVAWGFARTLRSGRVPLVGRIAAALDGVAWPELPVPVRGYTRSVTRAWAWVLGVLALADTALALLAVPGGLLARLGIAPPWPIAESGWSWFANIGDYVVIGGFMLAEYGYRRLRFPTQAPGLFAFLQRMARLGPSFWREALR